MKLFFVCLLSLIANYLFAQKKDSVTISIDTINIKGVVYGYNGKPAKNIEVGVSGGLAPGYPARVRADSNGYFILRGITPKNQLVFIDSKNYYPFLSINGSRFITVYLPAPEVREIIFRDSIIIKAQRESSKKKFSYREDSKELHRGTFPVYETFPEFRGGIEKFINYIRQNLVYPEKAIKNNIEGVVKIGFTIGADGSLTDFKILKGVGYGCDEEIIDILKKSPKWQPGISWGRPLTMQESVSVKFSLTDN